ncbi:sulfatase/phosphatase domain-containing protein [Caulobacter sp. 73W]|uniref:Sulfatase/phosphatase domain-containing protein n=1 Tax=Caulobacter sp. 73W TaxID=3161137 RepID=A0AB39KZZ0_9CAUL
MYYPTRMVRTRRFKLLYNIAHELTFPFAEDLLYASSWDRSAEPSARFGRRSVEALMHRPKFELYDLQADPNEVSNLADDPAYAQVKAQLIDKVKAFQTRTRDPWLRKWDFQ